jgi:NADPH:quinone reductase-like Zn-dependent oxidoreductase
MAFMKAAVCTRYGPPEVLQIRDVEKPVPRDGEVLIRIHAAAVTFSDCFARSGFRRAPRVLRFLVRLAFGMRGPRRSILGLVPAGEIEQIGKRVRRFAVGDRVFAFTLFHGGSYAQYTCLRENKTIALTPSNLSDEEAAAIPYGGLMALHHLRKGNIQSGQQVLIYGASGATGTSAVQLARHFGAEVTAVCSTTNLELVKSLGADTVIDYTTQHDLSGRKLYDIVLDAVGRRKTSELKVACSRAVAPGGKYLSVDDQMPKTSAGDLALLAGLAESGKLKPVIDRRYTLEQIAEAHLYAEQGHTKGNVVVTVSHDC